MRISDWSSDVCSSDLFLADQPDRGAQRGHGHRSHVLAVDRDRSRVQLVEAWDQVKDRRLAGTGRADKRHGLARRHVERNAVERRLAGFVGEVCVMQLDPALVDAQRLRIRTVGDGGTVVDHREDSFGGGKRSEEHTSELQSLMRISYAVFCLKKKKTPKTHTIAKR